MKHVITLFAAAAALGLAGIASAETNGVPPAVAAKKVTDDSVASPVKAKNAREAKVAKTAADGSKRNVASAKEGSSDPYAVPLFKDARQMR